MAERNDLIGASPASPIAERSAEEIRQHIADSRNSITGTVDRLSDRIQQTFDWRTYVADHPLATLSIAAGAGCLLAGIFRPRDTPSERIMTALADNVEDLADRFRNQLDGIGARRTGLKSTVKAAAAGAATKVVADYLRNRLVESGCLQPKADDDRAEQLARRANYFPPSNQPY